MTKSLKGILKTCTGDDSMEQSLIGTLNASTGEGKYLEGSLNACKEEGIINQSLKGILSAYIEESNSLEGTINVYTMDIGDGRDIELAIVENSICWRRVNDKDWNILVAISDISPKKGVDYYTDEDINEIVDRITPILQERVVSDKEYIHKQLTASNEWTIVHNLNKYPSVTVVDSADNTVVGDISYIDKNSLSIKFEGIFSGKCYIN